MKFSNDYRITCIVGCPGSGKSSTAQYIILDCLKKGKKVFSNMSFYGAYKLELEDLGKYALTNENEECVLIIDEAGICFNNRDWNSLPKNVLEFLKYHRHYRCDVYFFSQAADMDKSIRDLSQNWYKVIKLPLFLNRYSALIPVKVELVVNGGHWDLSYMPENNFFSWKIIPIYKTWKFYNSFSRKELLTKDFKKWEVEISKKRSFLIQFFLFLKEYIYKIRNTINKMLFFRKKRDKIIKNLKDGEYYEDFYMK